MQRADQFKINRETNNKKIRNKSIVEMIKREKVLDAIVKIRHSPDLKFLTERPKEKNEDN